MVNYVCGLMFSPELDRVALIRKNRPEFQRGRLNGIGGKIEENETPIDAMVREFWEETGCKTDHSDWVLFHKIEEYNEDEYDYGYSVCFYCCSSNKIDELQTMTDEPIEVISCGSVNEAFTMNNIKEYVPYSIGVLYNLQGAS